MQRGRHGQPPAVDDAAREFMVACQVEHGVAEQAADLALGRDEVGGARGVADVLVGRVFALGAVGGDQRGIGLAAQHAVQLPGQVLGILHAAVGAACAKRRDAVGAVARKDHAAMDEAVHAQAGEGVDAGPFQLEGRVLAQQGADAGNDVLGLFLFLGIGVPAQLEVDAPDIVGLAVQQHALARVEGRVEPEPALGGEFGMHLHVGDQEAVAEDAAMAFLAQQAAQRRARAVAGQDPLRIDAVAAVGRLHGQQGALGLRFECRDLAVPA